MKVSNLWNIIEKKITWKLINFKCNFLIVKCIKSFSLKNQEIVERLLVDNRFNYFFAVSDWRLFIVLQKFISVSIGFRRKKPCRNILWASHLIHIPKLTFRPAQETFADFPKLCKKLFFSLLDKSFMLLYNVFDCAISYYRNSLLIELFK